MGTIAQQLEEVVRKLTERFQINGVIPLTPDDIIRCIIEVFDDSANTPMASLNARLDTQDMILRRLDTGVRIKGRMDNDITGNENINTSITRGLMYTWPGDDRLHHVPAGFKFPSFNVATMWNLWFYEDGMNQICSYKHIVQRWI